MCVARDGAIGLDDYISAIYDTANLGGETKSAVAGGENAAAAKL